jgi:hypothetical protein
MIGDFENVKRVEAVCRAETGNAFEDTRAVNAGVEEEIDKAVVYRYSEMLGAIAEVDGNFDGFA